LKLELKADLSDKESIQKALKGAYGVYAVTNYWDQKSADLEFAQGKNIADACKVRAFSQILMFGFFPFIRY
jgi:uncharacterized protein YbjT (DUF2867 family)